MDKRSVLKNIDKAIKLLVSGEFGKALDVLLLLKIRLEEVQNKPSLNKKLQHMIGWYLKLWNDKPPESLRFVTYKELLGKHLRELIIIYERNGEDIEALKKDYEEYREKSLLKKGTGGLLEFRIKLPKIKAAQGKKEDSWCLENARPKSYYLKNLEE